jgi:hypothetical protein
LSTFIVDGYRRTKVSMRVEAKDEAEAIRKAKEGQYFHADTEPDCDLHRPAWRARRALHNTGSGQ